MEAIAAFSLACNVFQVLDFAYNLLKGGLYLAQPGEDRLPEHSTASALATDLRALTATIQANSLPSSLDPRLKVMCTRCDEVAQELIHILDSLKVTKRRQLVAKAIRSQLERKRIELLEQRLDRYRAEIQLYVTVELNSRIDAQIVQQVDAFKALSTDSQNSFLVLLTAVNDGTDSLRDQIDRQNDFIQSLHLDAKQTRRSETEMLRQQLAVESAQSRLQIMSNMQKGLDESTDIMGSKISDSTARLLTANSLMQDVMTEAITLNRQTVQEDINRLRENIAMVNLQIERTEAKLDEVILQLRHTRRDEGRRKELQHEGNRLTNFLLSLQALYRELQKLLTSLLEQARSFFGPLKFKELFGQQAPDQDQPVALTDFSRNTRSRSRWSLSSLPRIPTPTFALSDPGFHLITIRVRMMKPIRSTRTTKQGGHHRSLSTLPMSNPNTKSNSRYESINTDVLTLYYRYCYEPFLPPSTRLLSSTRWKHREHRLPNPLEEYKKNIRRDNVILGEDMAVIELARHGDEFVWFAALIVAAVQECVGWQRGTRIIRVVFSVVADWVDRIRTTGEHSAEFGVGAGEVGHVGEAILRLCREQNDDMVPVYAGRFDQKTVLGRRLGEDIVLWRKVADMSSLVSEMREFVQAHFGRQAAGSGSQKDGQYASVETGDDVKERVQDSQIAFLLIYTLMINRANMIGRIEVAHDAAMAPKHGAFPITRIPATIKWLLDIPQNSAAFVLATVLIEFGIKSLELAKETPLAVVRESPVPNPPVPEQESNPKVEGRFRDVVIKTLDLTRPSQSLHKVDIPLGADEDMVDVAI